MHNPQPITQTKDSRNRIQTMFVSASVPNSLSQKYEISILLMSGQELSEEDSENVYPTKSKSFWRPSTYHRAFSSSPLISSPSSLCTSLFL